MERLISNSQRHTVGRHCGIKVLMGTVLGLVLSTFLYQYTYEKRHVLIQETLQRTAEKSIGTNNSQLTSVWTQISKKHQMFLYSAFYDHSLPDRIRVIGVIQTYNRVRPRCLLHLENSTVNMPADIININEEHGKPFTAAYFLCYLCPSSEVPQTVSIYHDEEGLMTKLRVQEITHHGYRHNFTVCLSPFNNQYNNSRQLIDWIEMNRIFGATYFTFYSFSQSASVQAVLDYYRDINIADVLQWNINIVDESLLLDDHILHYYGQLAAINDCLYRNKRFSKYVVIVDVDEFIVPRHSSDVTWYDMLSRRLPECSVYHFRNTFFVNLQHPSPNDSRFRSSGIVHINNREDHVYPVGDRSKMIVKTSDAITVGIHEVWSLRSGLGSQHSVHPSMGLLHHYRLTRVREHQQLTVDRTMEKYTTHREKTHPAESTIGNNIF